MTQRFDTGALERLDDYARGQLPDGEVEAYEEELFARALAGEAPELTFRRDLEKTFRDMHARGTTDMWLDRQQAEAVLASGAKVLRFDLELNAAMNAAHVPDLSADFDLLLTRLKVDLRGLVQLDSEVLTPDGRLLKTMPEITFDAEAGEVYLLCEADLARAAATFRTTTKLWGTEPSGERRLLATISS